ncbi:MAG: YdeI/OmpD-associated family protein [Cytophagaceae bacterium]
MSTPNPKVNFFTNESKWQEEYLLLRSIALECALTEELKWGCPCYTSDGKNVVLIHGFKEYCALLFFKGAVMKDSKKVLIVQSENTQATRQIRFTNLKEIEKLKSTIKSYIKEAIELEKSGVKVEFKKTSEFKMVEEFEQVLKKNAKLKKAFESLTPGRQRAYLLFFSSAKQSTTRVARIEKCTPDILAGKGLND